jgi:hypothetical protein
MLRSHGTVVSKKLVLRFVLEHIDYRKRSLYLQEIIKMGRKEPCWRSALLAFFDTPLLPMPPRQFNLN